MEDALGAESVESMRCPSTQEGNPLKVTKYTENTFSFTVLMS